MNDEERFSLHRDDGRVSNQAPLPLSVELTRWIAAAIDARVRPLVELLRECRDELNADRIVPSEIEQLTTRIDAALKDAGAE